MTIVHVMPIRDLRAHVDDRACWCQPRIERTAQGLLVIHHAEDGRDLIERHGLQ